MLAQRQRDHASRFGIGHAARDRGGDRPVERAIGEGRQFAHHPFEREGPRQIADRQHQAERALFAPQRQPGIGDAVPRRFGAPQRRFAIAFAHPLDQLAMPRDIARQIGRMGGGAIESVGPG